MAYREVSKIEVKEILRLWLEGRSRREITRLAGLDRKTAGAGVWQLTDGLLGAVIGVVAAGAAARHRHRVGGACRAA